MFIISFLIQYIIMSLIMTNDIKNIKQSIGKVYISVIMGLLMVLAMMLFMSSGKFRMNQMAIYTGLLLLSIYLYKIQFGIDEANYLQEMIEHHSMALLTSHQMMAKTSNFAVADIANRIINTQEKEIQEMTNLLKIAKN